MGGRTGMTAAPVVVTLGVTSGYFFECKKMQISTGIILVTQQ
jgi:hypothetical protein